MLQTSRLCILEPHLWSFGGQACESEPWGSFPHTPVYATTPFRSTVTGVSMAGMYGNRAKT
jgi:hypothetical protein